MELKDLIDGLSNISIKSIHDACLIAEAKDILTRLADTNGIKEAIDDCKYVVGDSYVCESDDTAKSIQSYLLGGKNG